MTNLPKVYDPKKAEEKIYRLWIRSGFFNPDKLPKINKKPYCIVIPPPNITGELHMGHALNTIVQDILVRRQRMRGFKTLWLPGTDHAGIATQNVVEKELRKEGLSRFDLGREKFIERIWQWREKYGNVILEQLKKMGASSDWSRVRFTLDKKYIKAVETAFLSYYKKGWIYRGKRCVNWCPRCLTSLSDLELEYTEEPGNLWYIRYPLAKKSEIRNPTTAHFQWAGSPSPKIGAVAKSETPKEPPANFGGGQILNFIVVATTRPETMLGDTAVAVNPNDTRYKNLVGEKVILPLVNRKIPIIADKLVDPKFGTGAVKVTPGHDMADYEIGLRHNLTLIQVIGENGKITKEAPISYQGLSAIEARKKVIDDLKYLGLLEKSENYTHQIPKCYRCKTTVELIPSKQWFLKMDELAETAIRAVKTGEVKFIPKKFEKPYLNWLSGIKDWCISRQLWWGHQLPIWLCQIGRNSKFQIPNSKPEGEYFMSLKKPKKCPICGQCQPKQADDVLDTWFSSALWPFAALGWPASAKATAGKTASAEVTASKPEKVSDLESFYPTNVLSTGRDIINLWVSRMIFSGIEFMKEIPFKEVYIHPTVLTKEGKRMSKSLGTGINPMELVGKYGADALRFGIIWQVMKGQDIRFTEDNIIMGRKFCNKLWNASRFVLLQIGNPKSQIPNPKQILNQKFKIQNLTTADERILKSLEQTIKLTDKALENFQFGGAAHKIYDFFWHDFCDTYIEKSKKQNGPETKKILNYVLLNSLKILHPFIPFITEEIYQKLPMENKKSSLMIEKWPE